ncbi:related to benzoate 4-monooxygenase cytochrome P450 [Ramularia collo-cygni]|uniref:Related to benzoate 4-monooxygenase cytochrome P450 n=1 Tax=Ramularia collo-cygni TaxID=112498 RepID=A0A2D3V3A4_9PEZI|nr:related to benzoate 4-monooxygenase cytochrome P450 [Ramularia collo-cygni]CZT18016.1 related to benzoate 4-monooxygenase cytochrome P450 [Ramularia collo-cygni]
MAILEDLLAHPTLLLPTLLLLLLLLLLLIIPKIYNAVYDPIPGPLICRLTPFWTYYHSILGDESTQITTLHEKYGPIIRISPYEIVISEGEALGPIYSEKGGGFLKAPCYKNFDFEGVETIFSTLSPRDRARRSKAVMPLFSTGKLVREGKGVLERCAGRFVGRLQDFKDEGKKRVDVLDLARGFAIDAVCGYLFGCDYGGLKEEREEEGMSATGYVDSIVNLGRFFFLPPWLFRIVSTVHAWLQGKDSGIDGSTESVEGFTAPLVKEAVEGQGTEGTYQSRLLKAGISEHETDVQMKDVIFAGTDTSAMNLAMIVWNLVKYPECYKKLQAEILEAEQRDPSYNPQSLSYLDGVIREGLRTSLANATRFPRQVPPSGFTYQARDGQSYFLPGGTLVGMQPFTLHFNPEIFPDPCAFKPERWSNATPAMLRDFIPFGLGPRQCIARNLAMMELAFAVRALGRGNVLEGAEVMEGKIEVMEWFNSKVVGGKIEVEWK